MVKIRGMNNSTETNSTTNTTDTSPFSETIWELPSSLVVITLAYLCVNILVSLFINSLLIIIIQCSPALRTPPNSHLVNICINNILLSISMLLSMVCVKINTIDISEEGSNALSGIQLFIVLNALLQYWGSFAAIGYYRFKTIKEPSLSLKTRRHMVSKSISGNWIVSLILSMTCSLSFASTSSDLNITLDPFRVNYYIPSKHKFSVDQLIIFLVIICSFLVGFTIIVFSYYKIFKMLNIAVSFAKNRVRPWQRTQSVSVENLDVPVQRTYQPTKANPTQHAFTVSNNLENCMVHYQKCDHSLCFEDIIALENPIQAASRKNNPPNKMPVQATLSNISMTSQKSRCPDFTDISLGADMDRIQKLKNSSALQNQSLRRARMSVSGAARNYLVMFCAYLVCSIPLVVCSVPGALDKVSPENRLFTLFFCRLLFCVNAPIYPAWYLLFSRRVRKCLSKMNENLLSCFSIRR
ncbi:uncharacterized protein LOC121390092 [Gigantopelta aegis]|uniref:uncharacterized protein LOC121390092 n=1 Tax=Gigantopelta aegis TaxID=1735272 RepID=UPI001B88E786|nr:uncharacterized protein LOC121390092 [Gigantopelta aegis]